MAPQVDYVMRLCCYIAADQNINITFRQSAKGAMMVGGCALGGGLLGGPLGLAVVRWGGLVGCWATAGQFKPLPQVLTELTPSQQRKLYGDVMAVLGNLDWMDGAQLVAMVMDNTSLQQGVMAALLKYVTKDLKGKVQHGKVKRREQFVKC
ncbi:Protein C19orf12 [Merluccius polli]|uniref:Protein C19orf12 n=1 Tax=Merluccius polli TaxID=89951 RepID=A0AA47MWW8_MERPO|nr:Protein C19orf12 [Merluccius polli]